MQVNDVMTWGVECTNPNASLQEAAAMMKDLDVGFLPVCGDDDRVVGVITDRDITVRSTAEGKLPVAVKVGDVMTPEVLYCFEDASVEDAALLMQQNQVRRIIVLDHDKRLAGIFSLSDLAMVPGARGMAGKTLEEVSQPPGANW